MQVCTRSGMMLPLAKANTIFCAMTLTVAEVVHEPIEDAHALFLSPFRFSVSARAPLQAQCMEQLSPLLACGITGLDMDERASRVPIGQSAGYPLCDRIASTMSLPRARLLP